MSSPTEKISEKTKNLGALGLIIPIVVATGLVAASLSSTPTSETKPKLWCISNYLEKIPYEPTPQGKPRQDPLLDDKLPWLRRDQIEAETKEEAQKIFQTRFSDFITASNRDELKAALQKGDEKFFTHHYNAGATAEGPCEGVGDLGVDDGKWVADAQIEECGGDTGTKGPTAGSYMPVGKEFEVNITFYSPNTAGNTCDAQYGGGLSSADGEFFVTTNGKIKWHKGSKVLDHIFAQPQSNNIIPWKKIDSYAVLIPGFSEGPIEVHDHYGAGVHTNQNYLDLSYTCGEGGKMEKELEAIRKRQGVKQTGDQGTTVRAQIVNLDATRAQGQQNVFRVALNKISSFLNPAKSQTIIADTPVSTKPGCPSQLPLPGPSYGTDYHNDITSDSEAIGGGEVVAGGVLPNGVLDVPAIDESKYGLLGKCNRAAAGMAYLYRTGKQVYSGIGDWLRGVGDSTAGILANVGTGVTDRQGKCASSDNWAEIRNQVVNRKNPVVIALGPPPRREHYVTIVGFQGNTVYINDGAHFVGDGSGVKARSIPISELNQILHHKTSGCRYLYANP